MTVRRRPDNPEELQVIRWGMGTNGFRLILLCLVLSMHPMGRGFLSSFGFQFPDQQKLTEATTQATESKQKIDKMADEVSRLKEDIQGLEQKVDSLTTTFTGFQIDFQKYRKEVTPPLQ